MIRSPKILIAALLCNVGLSADFLTACGLLSALVSGLAAAKGAFFIAGGLLLLSGGLDLMDGAVARLSGRASVFGGILDSTLDRYGDAFIFSGILFWCARAGHWTYAALAMSALVGSFGISYVRARAECEIEACRVGYWERGERVVFLALGLLLNNLPVVLWVLGIATHFTVLYRLVYARQPKGFETREKSPSWKAFFTDTRRGTSYYFTKTALFILLVLLVHPGF